MADDELKKFKEAQLRAQKELDHMDEGEEEEVVSGESVAESFGHFVSSMPTKEEEKAKSYKDGADEEEIKRLGKDGATILGALSINQQKKEELYKKLMAQYAAEEEKEAQSKPKYAVNILSYGHQHIDYGEIFGDDTEKPGLQIWRMESWKAEPLPEENYGVFNTNDCYLILYNTEDNKARKVRIHMWIGGAATADKYSSLAFKSIELNTWVGGIAKILREDEGFETEEFKSYWKDSPFTVDSEAEGAESGFRVNTEKEEREPRLYRVQPAQTNKLLLVETSSASLNNSDVFVLDDFKHLIVYNSVKSSPFHRYLGVEIATRIKNFERSSDANIYVIDATENDANGEEEKEEDKGKKKKSHKKKEEDEEEEGEGEEAEEGEEGEEEEEEEAEEEKDELDDPEKHFWKILGGKDAVGDKDEEEEPSPQPKLFGTKINESGKPELKPIKETPFKKSMLEEEHVFILDANTEIFIWTGRKASQLEKQISGALAQKFFKQFERPEWTPIVKLVQDCESISFKEKFSDWRELYSLNRIDKYTAHSAPIQGKELKLSIDLENMFSAPEALSEFQAEKAGNIEVWNVESNGPKFVKMPKDERGHFYAGDCYLILYTYYDEEYNLNYLAYFWQGQGASYRWWPTFLFGFLPMLEKKLGPKSKDRLIKVLIPEHQEPDHLLGIFGGSIVIHSGRRKEESRKLAQKRALFSVCHNAGRTHSVQVEMKCESLNSRYTFVLLDPHKIYLWYGNRSSQTERDEAQNVAAFFEKAFKALRGSCEIIEFEEEEEIPEFWALLGGESSFANHHFWKEFTVQDYTPRLWRFHIEDGTVTLKECPHFSQSDLQEEDAFILDTTTQVFVWNGYYCHESLKTIALDTARKFVKLAATRRRHFVSLETCTSHQEPWKFKYHFHAWKHPVLANDPYEQHKKNVWKLIEEDTKAAEEQANEIARTLHTEREKQKYLKRVKHMVHQAKDLTTKGTVTKVRSSADHQDGEEEEDDEIEDLYADEAAELERELEED